MTEEEKKAIEYLKRHIIPYYGYKGRIEFMLNDVILNLIEKLKKENEELKLKDYYLPAWVTKKYVSKDKIREKIKDLQKDYNNDVFIGYEKITGEAIKKLKELLEEE